ncbi:TraR/DksA C4-type zinc finger protein [Microvirgula aerodenitrificans]|uniref:TraR/DksA C4-type zinc finger protein n=1 Tax=Microvirgula aerodenitrificans TaxID=57480 RepID=UPI001B800605|nr:TraR/DksA C4-type zinc finger protein [Microvirgula aerodenitrificans]
MDQFDQAQALEARHREVALTAHRERAARPSLSHCADCGDAIPEPRRLAAPGCTRCITCQSSHEKWSR